MAARAIPLPLLRFPQRPHPVVRGFRGLGAVTPVLSQSTVDTIAGAIQNQEGYYPGSVAYRNNNPGNLMYAGQAGATAGPGGFADFDSYSDGWAALENQIQIYAGRGATIQTMMNSYAPAGIPGNDPVLYANNIANALGGVSPDTPLVALDQSAASSPAIAPDLSGSTSSDPFSIDSISTMVAGLDPVTLAIGAGIVGLLVWDIVS